MKRALMWAGALAAASALFWMATGMGWWAQIQVGGFDEARAFLISLLHFVLIIAGIAAAFES